MKLFLASLYTLLRFKQGFEMYQELLRSDNMKLFLAGANGKDKIIPFVHGKKEQDMKLYMARNVMGLKSEVVFEDTVKKWKPFILESFYYADEKTENLLKYFGDFMLDSGAFTFMQNSKSHLDWEEYLERYADFVKRNKVQKFFELDIDSVVGYNQVKKYRRKLERLTGKQVIPVWHKSRGKEEFVRMCKEYDYVALGGIVAKEIKTDEWKYFPWFINTAHENECKIHGLGFTSLQSLNVYKFDSVDSTAWTSGNRFGFVYHFNGKTMVKTDCPKGKRLADSKKVALNNYIEWIKFQKYAEENL